MIKSCYSIKCTVCVMSHHFVPVSAIVLELGEHDVTADVLELWFRE